MENSVAHVGTKRAGFTARSDRWWLAPAAIVLGLLLFTAYAAWAALTGTNYSYDPYLSPFYSPLLTWPGIPLSPAILVLWAPLGFRASCYYYRKAYYRAFFWSPPACAVSEVPHDYRGEAGILKWLPRIHRWFLYLSIAVLAILWIDTVKAFDFGGRFGIGAGSIVLLLNVVFLTLFTFGCHALRSLSGGNLRCFSCAPFGQARRGAWRAITKLTSQHPLWAWVSLYSVAFADLYIRLLAMGVFHDPRIVF